MKKTLLLGVLVLAGCRTSGKGSELKDDETGGPTQTRPTWIKSPEAIEGTITQAWGISMTDKDRWKYLGSMYSMLGGTLVLNTKSLIDQPNELFLLGLDNLSAWLAQQLVDKQAAAEAGQKDHAFDGLGFSTDDAASCFADDAKDWCDFKDKVTLDMLTKAGADPANLSKQQKKRVMHNIQDIGEFMLLAIDNTLQMPGQNRHAAQYLLDEVFLDSLKGAPLTAEREKAAWKNVIYTIMMSGGFYLEAPADPTPVAH